MTGTSPDPMPVLKEDSEISVLALVSVLLRWRRTIVVLVLASGAAGLATGLLTTRVYRSSATFLPQVSEGSASGLALVASQFGIRVPSGGGWGPAVYVELLRSRALLDPIAQDTVVVAEQGGRRVAVMDLLHVEGSTDALRADGAVRALGAIATSREVRALGAVEVAVTTRWPSVSLALADRLVRGVSEFNIATRKSQAAAERQFVEAQAGEAERALREAEDRLQTFLQGNRDISSPQLRFEYDRLQRQVAFRQQVYTVLVQDREEARIREVRDTPVITVLEAPRLPLVSEPHRSVLRGLVGGLLGGMLGTLIAFLAQAISGAQREQNDDAREFFRLVSEATPRFLRRWVTGGSRDGGERDTSAPARPTMLERGRRG
ncbi:MAG: hypothetical protein DMD54_05125 [Gemmatimonadetes bacterium]|nr:MAG: hypothetical protein DMD54_05125 [Gemmatimonadota bacterium]